LIEDHRRLAGLVSQGLKSAGIDVDAVETAQAALDTLDCRSYDAMILDLGLPDRDGLDLLRQIRHKEISLPVLILTSRIQVSDRVKGLNAGADDYLTKPFALDELLARVRALLRRSSIREAEQGDKLVAGDVTIDPRTMEVTRGERRIELTRTEYQLLELFVRNPRAVLTRSAIFEHVWGYDFGPDSNSLDVYVGYLRRKLEAGGEPRIVHTVRGVGYALRPV